MTDPFNRDPAVTYERAEHMEPGVRRLTVRNPSPMTFTGTQTYIVGEGEVAVIDPGPRSEDHTKRILAALEDGERIGAILVTHTHVDHSPGAAPLREATGAPIYAFGAHGEGMSEMMKGLSASGAKLGGGEGADAGFTFQERMADRDTLHIGGVTLTAIHTPGHLSNHLSFSMDRDALFSGDVLMGWATTLVSPPEGDMAAFMSSLATLRDWGAETFYPGHGHPVTDPQSMIDYQRAHRRRREKQVLDALGTIGPATPRALTTAIYTDVDPRLHGAAARNVFATLLGLVDRGAVAVDEGISPDARFRLT